MNWTGGYLHRHSYKSNTSTTAVQRQHFARARSRIRNPTKAPSPFKIPAWAAADNTRTVGQPIPDSEDSTPVQQGRGSGEIELQRRGIKGDTTQPETISDFKESLLTRKDWADLSILRSPKIRFTSGEERYSFGRRRPLTEADRQRRASAGQTSRQRQLSHEKRPKRTYRGEVPTTQMDSDEISIHIGERPPQNIASSRRSSSYFQSQGSNDLMLLDREDAALDDRASVPPAHLEWETTPITDVSVTQSYREPSGRQIDTTAKSPSLVASPFPVLDRNGSFAVEGSQIKYVPPQPQGVTQAEYGNGAQPAPVVESREEAANTLSQYFSPMRNTPATDQVIDPVPFTEMEGVENSSSVYSPNVFEKSPANNEWGDFGVPKHANSAATPCPPRRFNSFLKPQTPRLRQTNISMDQEHRAQYQGHLSPRAREYPTRLLPSTPNRKMRIYGQEVQTDAEWAMDSGKRLNHNQPARLRTGNSQPRKITVYGQTVEFLRDDWPS